MSSILQHGTLQIDENMPFQRREWIAQRIGCICMAGVLGAALLGLFGNGPLSRTTLNDETGRMSLDLQRFWRTDARTTLRFFFSREAAGDGKVRLWMDRRWVESVMMERIEPEPESVQAHGHALLYTFAVGDPPEPTGVAFHFQPQKAGTLPGRASVDGRHSIHFQQFIYP